MGEHVNFSVRSKIEFLYIHMPFILAYIRYCIDSLVVFHFSVCFYSYSRMSLIGTSDIWKCQRTAQCRGKKING